MELIRIPNDKDKCDVCGGIKKGKINGNQLCQKHLEEYRNKNLSN